MKKIIRTSVFETNSSSAHSISIASDNVPFVLETITPDENGVIFLSGGEYGWEWFKSNNSLFKANYAAQNFSNNQEALTILSEVILKFTNATSVVYGKLDGYIDHESGGLVPTTADGLAQFIFNRNSWIFGGNDNSDPAPSFYDVPKYSLSGATKKVKYRYSLSIDRFNKKAYYRKKPTKDEITQGIRSLVEDYPLTPWGEFDMDTSIEHRFTVDSSSQYKFGYRKKIDLMGRRIPFILDGIWSVAKRRFDANPENKDLPWSPTGYNKVREIEESLINATNSPYVIWLNYTITKHENGITDIED